MLLASSAAQPALRPQANSGSVTAKALALLDADARKGDTNPSLSHALARLSSDMIAARIAHTVGA